MQNTKVTMEIKAAYKCQECDYISEETSDEPIYECGECGIHFARSNSADGNSHRCPDCNKFCPKLADNGCNECLDGPVEECYAYSCPVCSSLYDIESEAIKCCAEEGEPEAEVAAEVQKTPSLQPHTDVAPTIAT